MPSVYRVLAAICIVAMLPFASSSVRAADTTPFNIDAILSLNGGAAFVGRGEQQAFGLLETLVNQSGGVRGTPVHFRILDDESNPAVSAQLLNQVVASKAQVVLGSDSSATCNSMVPLVKNQILQYCLTPGLHPEPGSYSYSTGVETTDVLQVVFRYFRLKGMKRIALITSTDATGQDAEFTIGRAQALPENKEFVRVLDEHVNNGDVSAAAQLSKVKAANPDVLFVWVIGPAFQTILRGYNDAGLTMPIVANTANFTNAQNGQVAQYGIPVYYPAFRYFDRAGLPRGPLKDTVDAFYRTMDTAKITPDVVYGNVWDSGLLVVSAFRALGTNATTEQLKRYIDSQRSFPGINGIYNFATVPQRGLNDTGMVMTLWNPKATPPIKVMSKPGGVPLS